METTNFLLSDKVTGGTGLNFILVLDLKNPKAICEQTYDKTPTWKELADDLIEFCRQENICLSYLCEQGSIQQGDTRYMIAPCAVKYIAENIMANA